MNVFVRALGASGLVLTPKGGRPPKTARDVAALLAWKWFESVAPTGRPKLREAVVDLWQSKGYGGITDPAHVTARVRKAADACGADNRLLVFRGVGTTSRHVGAGAGVLLVPESSTVGCDDGSIRFSGPVWAWAYGDEEAQQFAAVGVVEFRAR